ncbi:MAG TPA: hypothetical protein VNK89_04620 [Thermoflexus sp.]|nr:hypothetical protein [Thermoflexus sp.]
MSNLGMRIDPPIPRAVPAVKPTVIRRGVDGPSTGDGGIDPANGRAAGARAPGNLDGRFVSVGV